MQYVNLPLCFELVAEPVVWQPVIPRAPHMHYLFNLIVYYLYGQSFDYMNKVFILRLWLSQA